ncbi:MAG: Fluoride ion transporter CrcB [Ktedonobacterales bacterium]|nr:MAG: Fluoride ion transporter CrcB [Ktedonobacterales bacterium]
MAPVSIVLAICVAGACGAVARYLLSERIARHWQGRFPLATFLINVTGAFALGFLLTAGAASLPALANLRIVIGSGFLGGYTTFSTLSFETHSFTRRGQHASATLNALGSLLAGVLAAALGIILGHLV